MPTAARHAPACPASQRSAGSHVQGSRRSARLTTWPCTLAVSVDAGGISALAPVLARGRRRRLSGGIATAFQEADEVSGQDFDPAADRDGLSAPELNNRAALPSGYVVNLPHTIQMQPGSLARLGFWADDDTPVISAEESQKADGDA